MALFVHRTTFQVLPSTSPASLTEPIANYVENPDLSAVDGFPAKYWSLTGDIFSLVDQATRDAIDAALLVTARDDLADDIDRLETFLRAFALVVLDEFNNLRSQHGLTARTISQLKNAVRNKLDA